MKSILLSLLIFSLGSATALALDPKDDPNNETGYFRTGAGAYVDQYHNGKDGAKPCDCDLNDSKLHPTSSTVAQPVNNNTPAEENKTAR